MHAATAAAAAAAAACMRACVAACVIDTMYQLIYTRCRPRRGESNFRIEIFEKNQYGQKDELGELFRIEIFANISGGQKGELGGLYTKMRFSTPTHAGLRVFCAYCKTCRVNLGSKSFGWPNVPVLKISHLYERELVCG
jgi:hypothetical protein